MKKTVIFLINLNIIEVNISKKLIGLDINDKNSQTVNNSIDSLANIINKDINELFELLSTNEKFIVINYFSDIIPLEINVSTTLDLNIMNLKKIQEFFMGKEYTVYFK